MPKGQIKGTSLIPLLDSLFRHLSRGHVTFVNNGNIKTLFFENQTITGSSSSDPSDYLGQYLINEGIINLEQFNRAYQTQIETDVRMAQVLQLVGLAPADKLRETIITKTVDTAFLVSVWQQGSWEADEKYPSAASGVEIRLSLVNLSNAIAKRQEEFLHIIEMFRTLGEHPRVNILDKDIATFKKIDQQIINLLLVGKTISEVLSLLPAHFYTSARHLLALYRDGTLSHGSGTAIDEQEIFRRLTATSGIEKPQNVSPCSEQDTAALFRAAHKALEEKDYAKAIANFRVLTSFNPHNIVFKDALNNAEYNYIVRFYKEVLPPSGRIKKGPGTGIIDDPIEKSIFSIVGDAIFSVRDIVGYLADRTTESRVLIAMEQLLRKKYLVEVK